MASYLARIVRKRLGWAPNPITGRWEKFKRMDAFKFHEQNGAPAEWRIGDLVQVLSINGDEIEFGHFKSASPTIAPGGLGSRWEPPLG